MQIWKYFIIYISCTSQTIRLKCSLEIPKGMTVLQACKVAVTHRLSTIVVESPWMPIWVNLGERDIDELKYAFGDIDGCSWAWKSSKLISSHNWSLVLIWGNVSFVFVSRENQVKINKIKEQKGKEKEKSLNLFASFC